MARDLGSGDPTGFESLSVTAHRSGASLVVEVRGEIDAATAPGLEEELFVHLAEPAPLVVVDLGRVTFFGSAGLAILVGTSGRLPGRSTLRLVASQPTVLRPLAATGLLEQFEIYAARTDALAQPAG